MKASLFFENVIHELTYIQVDKSVERSSQTSPQLR